MTQPPLGASEALTVRLNNGVTVLGRLHKGTPIALHYGNRTQAKRKADEIGGTVYHWGGPCFYVAPPLSEAKAT